MRCRAGVVTLMLLVVTACVPDPVVPPISTVVAAPIACAGITGDQASSLGDSARTVQLLQLLTADGSFGDFPDATLTVTAPATTRLVDGAYPFRVDLAWGTATGTPLAVFGSVFRLAAVTVAQPDVSVAGGGAASSTLTASGPTDAVPPFDPWTPAPVSVGGTITPSSVGTVDHRMVSVRLAVVVDSSSAGVLIGTVTLECAPVGVTLPPTTVI